MLFSPEEHGDNGPETWQVVKGYGRGFSLQTKDGTVLQGYRTKREAEAAKVHSFYVTLYEKERRWYGGEQVAGWRPFAEVFPQFAEEGSSRV